MLSADVTNKAIDLASLLLQTKKLTLGHSSKPTAPTLNGRSGTPPFPSAPAQFTRCRIDPDEWVFLIVKAEQKRLREQVDEPWHDYYAGAFLEETGQGNPLSSG